MNRTPMKWRQCSAENRGGVDAQRHRLAWASRRQRSSRARRSAPLRMQPSGRWAIVRPGRDPVDVEITSGDVFRVEVDGMLQVTRMGHLWGEGYYSVDGYPLRDGMRAAIGVEALPGKKRKCPTKASSAGCRPSAGQSLHRAARPSPWSRARSSRSKFAARRWRGRIKSDGTAEGIRVVGGHINRVPIALREGLRAGSFDGRERYAKPLRE
jgi:hypothetical protein